MSFPQLQTHAHGSPPGEKIQSPSPAAQGTSTTSLGSFLPVLLAPSVPHPPLAAATLGHPALCPLGLNTAPCQLRLGTWLSPLPSAASSLICTIETKTQQQVSEVTSHQVWEGTGNAPKCPVKDGPLRPWSLSFGMLVSAEGWPFSHHVVLTLGAPSCL